MLKEIETPLKPDALGTAYISDARLLATADFADTTVFIWGICSLKPFGNSLVFAHGSGLKPTVLREKS
jgi:hypothetical protein